MKKSLFKIILYYKDYKEILVTMLREYLEFSTKFLIQDPWKCSVNIDYELAKTFDNLDQFKAPKGKIFLAIFNNKVVGTASIKMIRNNASELKRMYIEPKYRRQKIGKFLLEYAIEIQFILGLLKCILKVHFLLNQLINYISKMDLN